MEDSILKGVKKMLGIDSSLTVFDFDILTLTNSAFATLNQAGIGPSDGFSIEDDTSVWSDFIGTNLKFNLVQTYVYLSVRIKFDPPQTSYLLTALQNQIDEQFARLLILRESTDWVAPIV